MKELLTVKANVDRIMGYEEEKQTERDYAQERSCNISATISALEKFWGYCHCPKG